MKKKLSTLLSLALFMSMLFPNVSFAQSQTETATFSGHPIKCSLVCDFYPIANDKATAKSTWDGKKGYQVSVVLYQCQNAVDSYHKIDTDFGDIGAKTIGSVSGVWKFKSVHGARKNGQSNITNVCELTDW